MSDNPVAPALSAVILEGDVEHARVLAATFELQGIDTTVLHSLESATECIDRLQPQIVTYDLSMIADGEKDLIESLRKMRAADVDHMVLFSGSSKCKVLLDELEDDLGHVIVKPVKLSQMLALVIELKTRCYAGLSMQVA